MKKFLGSANPYLPLWEHIPDGEPRVFWYKGEKRVFIYGSHDTNRDSYCGQDYVTWSAPVNDLTNWTYHGVIYESKDGDALYAPDVVEKDGVYYLYSADDCNAHIHVSKSDSPAGPFVDTRPTDLGFDPGVLVDDDGRTYVAYGFFKNFVCELEPDMATVKEGSVKADVLPRPKRAWGFPVEQDDKNDPVNGFYEAASFRKIMGKYVIVYSKISNTPSPELGIHGDSNAYLSYMFSDSPTSGYRFGGDIIVNRGEIITDREGKKQTTFTDGNNHGGLAQINGKWYMFYHRQTGENDCSRQAMLEPVDVALGKDGKLYIGDITYVDGEPVSSKPVEMTSQGPYINGIDVRLIISAGFACHIYGGSERAYPMRIDGDTPNASAPVVHITNGTSVGFRYLQFGAKSPDSVTVKLNALTDCDISVRIGHYRGKEIAYIHADRGSAVISAPLTAPVIGKQAVYFIFNGESGKDIAEFDYFTFDD